jgi:hypothetical protein
MLKVKEWLKANKLGIQFTVMKNKIPNEISEFQMKYHKSAGIKNCEVATRLKDNKDFILFQTLKRRYCEEYEIDIFLGKFHDDLKNVSIVSYFSNVNENLGRIYDSSDCEINSIESEIELLIKKTLDRIKKIHDAKN